MHRIAVIGSICNAIQLKAVSAAAGQLDSTVAIIVGEANDGLAILHLHFYLVIIHPLQLFFAGSLLFIHIFPAIVVATHLKDYIFPQ